MRIDKILDELFALNFSLSFKGPQELNHQFMTWEPDIHSLVA